MTIRVQTDAARTDRSLTQAPAATKLRRDPELQYWRRLLSSAAADARKTRNGLPTDSAILAMYWIFDFRPQKSDRVAWSTGFECACDWLSLDPLETRRKMRARIDEAHVDAYKSHIRRVIYQHRAAVLSCAGEPTAIAGQYILPLVSVVEYELVAGIDGDDMFALYE
jgi:hypothetical protein